MKKTSGNKMASSKLTCDTVSTHRVEKLDLAALAWIVKNPDEAAPYIRTSVFSEPEQDPFKRCQQLLKSLRPDGSHIVPYHREGGKRAFGRMFVKGLNTSALQNLPREIRHTLAHKYYWDLDMVNAQPTLAVQLCEKHSIPCPCLKEYVANRHAILEELQQKNPKLSRDDLKIAMISMLNGGSVERIAAKTPWLVTASKEFERLRQSIANLYPEEIELVKKGKRTAMHNLYGQVTAKVLQHHEHQCLVSAVNCLDELGYQMDVLIFDGGMIRKQPNKEPTPELLQELSTAVHKDTGFHMQWAIKPMEDRIPLPEDYDQNDLNLTVIDGLTFAANDTDMRRIVRFVIGKDFVCADPGHDQWYYFDGNRWCSDPQASHFNTRISQDVVDFCIECKRKTTNEIDEKVVVSVINKLKSYQVRKVLIADLRDELYDRKFLDKLDANPDLLGFDNGVYDLKEKCFRSGRKEDYLSMSVGYEWVHEDLADIQQTITDFIKGIMPNEAMETYMWQHLAYQLTGSKLAQLVHIWTGAGGNGKSVLLKLMDTTLGQYQYKPNAIILTGETEKIRPEIAKSKGVRSLMVSEPDGDKKLAMHRLKEWSGEEKIQGCEKYKAPVEFMPQFGIGLICNDMPEMSKLDGGVKRRLRVILFVYQFKDKPDPKNPYEKQVDYTLGQRFKNTEYAQQFMRMLVKEYTTNGDKKCFLSAPAEVTEATDSYYENNNKVGAWLEENFDRTYNNEDKFGKKELYDMYKSDTRDHMTIQQFCAAMTGVNGVPEAKVNGKRYFKGIKPKEGTAYGPDEIDG